MAAGQPFSKTKPAALTVHGWTFNGAGVTGLHRLRSGKFLRRYSTGWTATPAVIPPSEIFATENEARAAFEAARARRAA
jgi:hypothetical protein